MMRAETKIKRQKALEPIFELLRIDVENIFGVDLLSSGRQRDIVNGRIAFSHIAREHLNVRLIRVGELLGKTHASVIHYNKNFEGIYKSDKGFRTMYDKINTDFYLLRGEESINAELEVLEKKKKYLQDKLAKEKMVEEIHSEEVGSFFCERRINGDYHPLCEVKQCAKCSKSDKNLS